MFWQEMIYIYSIAKESLVIRGLDFLMGKINCRSGLENLERNFKALKARADDLEKDISNSIQRGRKRKRHEVVAWFREVKKVKKEYRTFKNEEQRKGFLKKMFGTGDQEIELNARISDLDDRSRQFGELVVGDDKTRGLPRPTTALEGETFRDNFERIWNFLENDQVSSIGVHGMGGVGKSTLVEHIYNRLLQKNKSVFWVVVSSQCCSIKMLQDKIARKLDLDDLLDEDDEGARAGRLNNALSQRKNFVLVLDDVWERFDLVKVGVPLSMEGCKWMITSRSLTVCQQMNCQEMIAVKPLSKDEGWNLFLKNVGQNAILALGDPKVEEIGKRMVKICDGLPLGIITLAGAVSGVTEIQEWRHELRVLKESGMGHEWMEEKVFRVLKYSFDRLTPNDQLCLLYCSLYPEDYVIPRVELFNKFISEELVDTTKTRASQRDEGHSVLLRLSKVSLLENVSDQFNGECVKMHDLVRAMTLKISKGKIMVRDWRKKLPIEEKWGMDLEKASLMWNLLGEIPHGFSPNCPRLSTLLLPWNVLRGRIPTSFFSRMCGLRTLDLSHTEIEELPVSVSDLVELTSLLLGGCYKLRHVPCVRKLKELKELDLSDTSIEDVPQGTEELVNIRCLSINGAYNLSRTSLVLKSPWLQVLLLPYTIHAELVEGSAKLEVFQGWLKGMSDFNILAASKKDGISYLIVVSDPTEINFYIGGYKDDKRTLIVCNYNLKDGEKMESTVSAEFIHRLEFKNCKGLGKCLLDDLSNSISLNELEISHSRGIECILTYGQFKAPQEPKSRFEALKEIELVDLQDFNGLIYPQEVEAEAAAYPSPHSAFSSLRKLSISNCNKMKKLGLPISVYEKLEYISIQQCEELEEVIQVAAAVDDDSLIISLPDLTYLSLVMLPSLESFCDAPVICNSITSFELKECPRLEEPSFNWGAPDSYKPLFAGTSSSRKKEWWEIDLFRHRSR